MYCLFDIKFVPCPWAMWLPAVEKISVSAFQTQNLTSCWNPWLLEWLLDFNGLLSQIGFGRRRPGNLRQFFAERRFGCWVRQAVNHLINKPYTIPSIWPWLSLFFNVWIISIPTIGLPSADNRKCVGCHFSSTTFLHFRPCHQHTCDYEKLRKIKYFGSMLLFYRPLYSFLNNNTPHSEQRRTVLIRQLLYTVQWQHATQWATPNRFKQTNCSCANSCKQSILYYADRYMAYDEKAGVFSRVQSRFYWQSCSYVLTKSTSPFPPPAWYSKKEVLLEYQVKVKCVNIVKYYIYLLVGYAVLDAVELFWYAFSCDLDTLFDHAPFWSEFCGQQAYHWWPLTWANAQLIFWQIKIQYSNCKLSGNRKLTHKI